MILNISEIRSQVRELGALISAPVSYLTIPDGPTSDGTPYIEIVNGAYHYVSSERGMEISRRVTCDVSELLYWIFKRIASAMANDYEFSNRIDGLDPRRLKFSRQIEIVGKLDNAWSILMKYEIEEILQSAPYDDLSGARVELCKVLMNKGMAGDESYAKACEKFPLPVRHK